MLVRWHILIGIILALIFLPWLQTYSLLFLVAFVIIDIDHYFFYMARKKSYNLLSCYRFFRSLEKRKIQYKKYSLCIFHTAEFLFLLFLAALFNQIIAVIFLGAFLHTLADVLDVKIRKPSVVKTASLLCYLKLPKEAKL